MDYGTNSATSMSIVIDRKCNIRCAHCCFSSNPQATEQLNDEQILNLIRQSGEMKELTTIGISGGEAMLRRPLLISCLKEAKRQGKMVTLTSNAFWGQTFPKAVRDLTELQEAGLDKLTISFDDFHLAYLPVERVKNVLLACREVQMQCQLNVAVSKTHTADGALAALGEAALGITIIKFATQAVGAAKEFEDEEIIRLFPSTKGLRCPGFEPTYHFDGKVYPCCSPAVFDSHLQLGSVDETTISEACEKISHNALLAVIRKDGFEPLYDEGIRRGLLSADEARDFVDACDACHRISTKKDVLIGLSDEIIARSKKFEITNDESRVQ